MKNQFLTIIMLCGFLSWGQTEPAAPAQQQENPETGVSVSPSTLRFNAKPGSSQTKTINVTNDTKRKMSFQISFQDIAAEKTGRESVAADQSSQHSLSKYLIVSPAFVELAPRESKVITISASIPAGDSAAIAMWTTLVIDQVKERSKLEVPNPGKNTIGLGINAGIGFGVNVYQNPPNVLSNNVEITNLKFEKRDGKMNKTGDIAMEVKNTGDGIGYCLYYLEVTHLATGRQTKFKVKQFGILPGYSKGIKFDIPAELPKGNYSGLAVLDFGDKDVLQTAELEFKLD